MHRKKRNGAIFTFHTFHSLFYRHYNQALKSCIKVIENVVLHNELGNRRTRLSVHLLWISALRSLLQLQLPVIYRASDQRFFNPFKISIHSTKLNVS